MPRPTLPNDLIAVLESMPHDALRRLLSDLLSPAEVDAVAERWEIVKLLASGHSQRDVRDALGVGVATVSRGSRQLKYGHEGFADAFDALPALGFSDPRAAIAPARSPREST